MRRLILILFVLLGCESPVVEPPKPQINLTVLTDSTEYILGAYPVQVQYTIVNSSGPTAYFYQCAGSIAYFIDHKDNGQWVQQAMSGFGCDVLPMGSRNLPKDSTYWDWTSFNVKGTYRLIFPYSATAYTSAFAFTDSCITKDIVIK